MQLLWRGISHSSIGFVLNIPPTWAFFWTFKHWNVKIKHAFGLAKDPKHIGYHQRRNWWHSIDFLFKVPSAAYAVFVMPQEGGEILVPFAI